MLLSHTSGIIVFLTTLSCLYQTSLSRPKELDEFYKQWRPLELVRGLRALSVDPFDVYRSLEAVKDLDSEEALDVMHDLDVRPITIYDALEDLGVNPYDAYYALKAWLTDPLLHQPGDHYHRVNTSGDPTHPYLHIMYKKTDGEDDYKPYYMTSQEIEKELDVIEKQYKEDLEDEKFRMNEFISKAKEIHSAFDDPSKVFKDFFGKRHFDEWKNMFPEAFKNLKDIYKNPLGFSLKKDKKDMNESSKHDKVYEHLHKGREFLNKEADKFVNLASRTDSFSRFDDPSRFDTLADETHTENVGELDNEEGVKNRIHHTKIFYDKLKDTYIECKETQENVRTESGTVQRVKSNIRYFDPKSFELHRKEQDSKHHQQQQTQQQPQQQPPQQQQQPAQPQQQPPQPQQQPPQQQQYHPHHPHHPHHHPQQQQPPLIHPQQHQPQPQQPHHPEQQQREQKPEYPQQQQQPQAQQHPQHQTPQQQWQQPPYPYYHQPQQNQQFYPHQYYPQPPYYPYQYQQPPNQHGYYNNPYHPNHQNQPQGQQQNPQQSAHPQYDGKETEPNTNRA